MRIFKFVLASFMPKLSRPAAICAASIFLFSFATAGFASTNLFTNGSAWLTAANWSPSGPPATNGIAQFGTTLPTKGNGLALNCDKSASSFNNGPTNEAVGAIQVLPSRSSDFALGNSSSSGTNGFITFTGATIGGLTNVIIENASPQTFTIQNTNPSGVTTVTLGMVLANPVENIILLDGTGAITISNIISSSGASTPLTFSSTNTVTGVGKITIAGTSNTFTGNIKIGNGIPNAPEVPFAGAGSLGNPTNAVTVDGGRFTLSASTDISTHPVFLGSNAGTSISVTGSGIVTNNGVIADEPGSSGILVKQGGGTLCLGGMSTFSGNISINNGTIQLLAGSNRLPTNAVVNLGQLGSSNTGILDLNGQNQAIAGLISTTGTSDTTVNFVTNSSTTNTILTFDGAGTYAYGSNSTNNSGIITGPITLVLNGSGTQTLGGSNSYTGGTTINAGQLFASNSTGSATGSGSVTVSAGALAGNGTLLGVTTVAAGGIIVPGLGAGDTSTLTISNNLSLSGTVSFFLNRTTAQNSSRIAGISNLAYGGSLVVSNVATPLQAGDTFTLFIATNATGNFASTNLPALTNGLVWNWNSTNGQLSVISTNTPPATPPLLTAFTLLTNGEFQFSFTNITGSSFTVFASTNVALPFNIWSNLGPALESPAGSGQFQFIDPQSTNNPQTFYRVTSP